MRIRIIEDKGRKTHVCDNDKCPDPLTNKVLKITENYGNYLHICFNCLKKGISLNLEVSSKQ